MTLLLHQQETGEMNLPSATKMVLPAPSVPCGQDAPSQDRQGAQGTPGQLEELTLLLQGKGQSWKLALPKKVTRLSQAGDTAIQCLRESGLLIARSFACKW